ncbi:MAG: hypothetical protein ACLQPH_04010 [Acidimicrobiales bacterium]
MTITTTPLHISDSLKRLLVDQLDADTLRHLAALKDAESPRRRLRAQLTEQGIEELAELICAGRTPTVGFFQRRCRAG